MRGRTLVTFIFLAVLAFILIFLNVKGADKPVNSAAAQAPRPFVYVFSGIGNSFKSFFSYFSSVAGVNRQNAALEEQIRQLQQDNVTLQQYALENQQLRQELNYRQDTKFQLISGTVIGKDPVGFSQTVIINIGSHDGVQQGSAVLAQGVLIGRVTSVDAFTSKVLLITDPQSTIVGQISATGDNGTIEGSGASGMIIDNLTQNIQLNHGDEVVSAGINTDIPKGILIGTIDQILSQKNDLNQKATVLSSADMKNLKFIAVIKK